MFENIGTYKTDGSNMTWQTCNKLKKKVQTKWCEKMDGRIHQLLHKNAKQKHMHVFAKCENCPVFFKGTNAAKVKRSKKCLKAAG